MNLPVTPASGTCLSEGRQGKQLWRSILTCLHGMSIPLSYPEAVLALPKHFCTSRLTLHFGQGQSILHPSGITQPSCRRPLQETHTKPWCAFLVGGLEGPEWHWVDKEAEVGHPVGPGTKLPGLWPDLEEFLQEFI